jgi:hypothetical protein
MDDAIQAAQCGRQLLYLMPIKATCCLHSGAMDYTVQLHTLDAPPATHRPVWRASATSLLREQGG